MAWKEYKTAQYRYIDTVKRPWGWESRVCVQIDDSEYGIHLYHSTKPSSKEIEKEMDKRVMKFVDDPVEIPKTVEEEYNQKLVNKGYLAEGQTIDDLPTKSDLLAKEVSK